MSNIPIHFISFEFNNFFTQPVIQLSHTRLNRLQFIGRIDLCRLPNRSKPTRILRNNPHQLRRNAQACQHVIPRRDIGVRPRYLTYWPPSGPDTFHTKHCATRGGEKRTSPSHTLDPSLINCAPFASLTQIPNAPTNSSPLPPLLRCPHDGLELLTP